MSPIDSATSVNGCVITTGNYNYKDQPTRQNGPAIKHIFRYRLRAFAPSCIGKYQERKFQGANVPQLELSLPGANGLGSKKSIYKDTDLVLYSLTTVRAFSFQSSVINSDILSSIHKTKTIDLIFYLNIQNTKIPYK